MIRHGSDRVEKLPINLSGAFLFCCMIVAYYEIIAYGGCDHSAEDFAYA